MHPSRFIFLADADLLCANRLHRTLGTGIGATLLDDLREAWTSRSERRAVIVPAFERLAAVGAADDAERRCGHAGVQAASGTPCLAYASLDVPLDKPELQRMLADEKVLPFYERTVRFVIQLDGQH